MFANQLSILYLSIGAVGFLMNSCGPYLTRSSGSNSVTETLTMTASPSAAALQGYMGCTATVTITNTSSGISSGTLTLTETDVSNCVTISNDTCSGQSLVPTGTCTYDLAAPGPICGTAATVEVSSALGGVTTTATYDGSICAI